MAVSIASRVLSPIVLLIGTFLFGISPIAVTRTLLRCDCQGVVCKTSCRARKGKIVTALLVYFGGGVLLATCLVHLLPEAREGFEHSSEHQKLQPMNDTDLIALATVTETLPTSLTDVTGSDQPVSDDHDDDAHSHDEQFSMPEFVTCLGFFAVYLVEEVVHYLLGSHGHSHVPTESRAIRSLSRSGSCPSAKTPTDEPSYVRELQDSGKKCPELASSDQKTTGCFSSTEISLTGLLTLIALSFHSVFEGFAIGIQDSDSGVWILFAAVSVHKFVIAFVVGLEVLTGGGKPVLLTIYMAVFAGMSPLGMIIAFITQASVEENDPLLVGVLNAIATGTLLYVTFCEILQREEEHRNLQGWQQFLATFIGFGVMCLVQYATTLA